MDGHTLVVFDGVCNLCNGLAGFVLRHDRRNIFRFGYLQTARDLPSSVAGERATIIVLRAGRVLTESDAVLAIFADLGGIWTMFTWLGIVPRRMRDGIYRYIARHRYRWFGKRTACAVPDEASRHKFV